MALNKVKTRIHKRLVSCDSNLRVTIFRRGAFLIHRLFRSYLRDVNKPEKHKES